MKVRLLEGRYQDGDAFANVAGDIINVPDSEGRRLIEAGSAEPVARKQTDERETRATATASPLSCLQSG